MTDTRRIVIGADYYRVLGVPPDASAQDIRRAYRRLARQHHPDTSGQDAASDRFRALSEAYEVLHDPEQRSRYDHSVGNSAGRAGAAAGHRAAAQPPPAPRGPAAAPFFAADRFASRPRPPTMPMADAEGILELSPQEAALAATAAVTLTDAQGHAIELPPGIHHGQRLRIPRARRRRGQPPADLILTVQVRGRAPYLT